MPPSGHLSLDANATTAVCRAAIDAMLHAMEAAPANPSSVHDAGVQARFVVENARASIAANLGCDADGIIFTGCGTEASNLGLRGATHALLAERFAAMQAPAQTSIKKQPATREVLRALHTGQLPPIHIVTTHIEHPAVLATVAALESEGLAEATRVSPGRDGIVTAESVASALRTGPNPTGIVSVMLANNETGALQPVSEIAKAAHSVGAVVHTDAVQAVGKIPVNAGGLGVDLLSLSAHKFGGPKGVGALVVRGRCTTSPGGDKDKSLDHSLSLSPILHGGGHEFGLRPGTHNVPGIAGMAAALDDAMQGMAERMVRLRALANRMRGDIAGVMPTTRFNSPKTEFCLPNTLNFTLPSWMGASGLDAHEAVRQFASRGISISAASACAAGRGVVASHVLLAQGLSREDAKNSLRISLPPDAGTKHVEAFFDALIQIAGGWCG